MIEKKSHYVHNRKNPLTQLLWLVLYACCITICLPAGGLVSAESRHGGSVHGYRGGNGHHGYHGHSDIRFGFGFGGPFWGPSWYDPYPGYYPYYNTPPYPYYYVPDVNLQTSPPVYIERRIPEEQQAPPPVWYYCPESATYYPYVRECPGGWEKVPAKPAEAER